MPPSDALLAICKLYGTSADYLLGLTDIDPSDEARKQRQRLTEEEQNEMHRYEEYLLWKRKNKPPSETIKVAGRLFVTLLILVSFFDFFKNILRTHPSRFTKCTLQLVVALFKPILIMKIQSC